MSLITAITLTGVYNEKLKPAHSHCNIIFTQNAKQEFNKGERIWA